MWVFTETEVQPIQRRKIEQMNDRKPLYSIGTWDTELQAFAPHDGVPAFNLTRRQLVASMRMLQATGWYTCHRFGNTHSDDLRDSDTSVMIERTDGLSEAEILMQWRR